MEQSHSDKPAPPIGVIEALASGFDTVVGCFALMLIPLVLDILLWVGPRFTIQPLAEDLYFQEWLPYVMEEPGDQREFLQPLTDILSEAASDEDLQYLPSGGTLTLMTARAFLLSSRTAEALPFHFIPPVWIIDREADWLGIMVAAFVLGTALTTLQIAMVGQQIQGGRLEMGRLFRSLPLMWLRLVGFGVVMMAMVLFILMPVSILYAMFLIVGQNAASMVMWFGRFIIIWSGTFLFFTIHGIVMNNRGVLRSLWDSIRVVHWNLPATILLLLLIVTLGVGLSMAWLQAPLGSWLALLGIAGNAFVTTGLIAATFVFFQDRYRYWNEIREMLLATPEQLFPKDRGSKEDGA